MIASINNAPAALSNLPVNNNNAGQITDNTFNSSLNAVQLPILQLLFSFIVSIVQQLLSQLMQQANPDKPDQPDTETPGATDSGNPSILSNINSQQDANIRFLFNHLITPEIIERTKDFTRPYVISDDDNSGSISVGDRLLVGDRIHADLQEYKLTDGDVRGINGGALGSSES